MPAEAAAQHCSWDPPPLMQHCTCASSRHSPHCSPLQPRQAVSVSQYCDEANPWSELVLLPAG